MAGNEDFDPGNENQGCTGERRVRLKKLVNNPVSLKGINLINITQTKVITVCKGQSVDKCFKRS